MRVLLVEDHAALRRSVAQGLREAGYVVDASGDGEHGLGLARGEAYDAIILDLMLPRRDGMGVLTDLRAAGDDTPILILTARDALDDRVRGLDAGADDYLVKPFAFDELLARLRVLIRRRYATSGGTIDVADLRIDLAARIVRRGGALVELSAREYAILEYLALRRGAIVTRAEIHHAVYDLASEPGSNVIDVYIGYLRKKVDRGHSEKLIQTCRGMGYRLGPAS